MNSMILSYLEVLVILSTAIVLGIMIYEMKKSSRKRYTIISAGVLIFGFVICVVMSSLEKERLQGSLVIGGVIALYLVFVLVLVLVVLMITKKNVSIRRDVIVEAFDKINIGVCYYDSYGRIVLCNEYMHEISIKGLESRVLNGIEFWDGISAICYKTESGNIYELPIEEKYYSVYVGEIAIGNDILTEIIIADTTNLKDKKNELELNNHKLTEVNKHLIEYGEIADSVIREQEILNAKIQVHDRFGDLLLTTKRGIEDKLPSDEVNKILESIKDTLTFMKFGENDWGEDSFKELEKTANSIGVKIHLTGIIPMEKSKRNLVLLGIKESLTNTVKHASGHNLYVYIGATDKMHITITNDGNQPKKNIILGTGLTALKSKVDKAGGVMSIVTDDGFTLHITI